MEVDGAVHSGFFFLVGHEYIWIYIYVFVESVEMKPVLDPILCFAKPVTQFKTIDKVTFCV
jgi:hypothetical protein